MQLLQVVLLLSKSAFGVTDSPSQFLSSHSQRRLEQLEPAVCWYARWQGILKGQSRRKAASAGSADQLDQAVSQRRTAGSEQVDDNVAVQVRIGSGQPAGARVCEAGACPRRLVVRA